MEKTFQIGIPTINRADLLNQALKVYFEKFPTTKIHIWDNGVNQNIDTYPNTNIHRSDRNLGVAASWNKLCKIIYQEATHALILNDDVILGCGEANVSEYIQEQFDFATGHGFHSFIIPQTTTDKIGWFDEKFYPAYFEDGDYWYRLRLARLILSHRKFIVPKQIEGCSSCSIKKDPSLHNPNNKEYYLSKWGGMPHEEKYLTPFNQQ